ncbi:hypothetical protein KR093_009369, partial [Drosophila rubida]
STLMSFMMERKRKKKRGIFRASTLSNKSMNAVALTYVRQKLNRRALRVFGDIIRNNVIRLLAESTKHCIRTGGDTLDLEHLEFSQREMGHSLDMLHIRVNCKRLETRTRRKVVKVRRRVPVRRAAPGASMPTINLPEPLRPKWDLKRLHSIDDVLIMKNRCYPLSRERQAYYVHTTDKLLGNSEEERIEMLHILELDPSYHYMLPQLASFVNMGIQMNLYHGNFVVLTYLLRAINSLLRNHNLEFRPYLHLILPVVVSCVVSAKLGSFADKEDHWAMRELASEVTAHILRHFDGRQRFIRRKVVRIYLEGMDKSSMATVYGSILGFIKMGRRAFQKHVMPRIGDISDRIEPLLTKEDADEKDIEYLSSKYLRLRLIMETGQILRYTLEDDEYNDETEAKVLIQLTEQFHEIGRTIFRSWMFYRVLDDAYDECLAEELERIIVIQ